MAKPPRSLRSRALQLLAQREQSKVELRRKLRAHARALAAAQPGGSEVERAVAELRAAPASAGSSRPVGPTEVGPRLRLVDAHFDVNAHTSADTEIDADANADAETQVEAVLAWLEAKGFLSPERFVESRVHARAGRFGNLRIRHELMQHDVTLSPAAERALADTEMARARAVRERKFPAPPQSAAERARQARFLGARGFSPDVIHRVLREASRGERDDS